MKILLLGKNGQVGWELQRSLAVLGEVVALDRHSTEFCGDLSRLDALAQSVRAIQPNVVVNAAAYTAVDKAEAEADLAFTINSQAPEILARECAALGALLVHYSTDYVFDGTGQHVWVETDDVAPLSVYGRTKLSGEQAITASGCRHLIFRTSWVYGSRGHNFARTMLRLAAEREQLSVINDQVGAPTSAELLADIAAHAIRTTLDKPHLHGLYHCVASGETTWFEYASYVIEFARRLGVPLAVQEVLPVPTSEYPTAAQRPLNSRLNTEKLQLDFALRLPPWQQGVERMLQEILG